jgi:hypothetical protein
MSSMFTLPKITLGVIFPGAVAYGFAKEQRLRQQEVDLTAQLKARGFAFSGIEVERRPNNIDYLKRLWWMLPDHHSLLIPCNNTILHRGLDWAQPLDADNWHKHAYRTAWRDHKHSDYANAKKGLRVPAEVFMAVRNPQAGVPKLDINKILMETCSPEDHAQAGRDPELALHPVFYQQLPNAWPWQRHDCQSETARVLNASVVTNSNANH